jgi:RNA-directed DNA polymerase
MKRKGNLYHQIISTENIELADKIARRGKRNQKTVLEFDKDKEINLKIIQKELTNRTYQTSPYQTFIIKEPKERLIYRLPYKDRVVQHAIMNVARPTFVSTFTDDTYSCIKGRGIHKAVYKLKESLKDRINTKYYLKIDIKKFYQSINHAILKQLLRKKFKDNNLLNLLGGIIDSAPGLPIGNYLSQYLANFYLAYFDHWVKEIQKVLYYFRYADDMIFLASEKPFLHRLLFNIKTYLKEKLDLTIKQNYRIAPVRCGIDFLGYIFRHGYTKIRPEIKQTCARMLSKNPNPQSIYSYIGWFCHANTINLQNKLIYGRA